MISGVRIPALVSALVLLLSTAAFVVPRFDVRTDLSFFLPDDPPDEIRMLVEHLREGSGGAVVMIGLSDLPPDQLAAASVEIADSLQRSEDFAFVTNGRFDSSHRQALEYLVDSRYLLAGPATPDAFSRENLNANIKEQLAALSTSRGWLVRDLLFRDPTGVAATLMSQRVHDLSLDLHNGVWLGTNPQQALILARTTSLASDLAAQSAAIKRLDEALAPWIAEGISVVKSGPGILALETRSLMRSEMNLLSIIAGTLVACLLLLAFRSPIFLLVLVLPIGSAVLAGAAAVQLLFGHIHGVTLTFGVVLIGLAVDYPLHFVCHLTKDHSTKRTMKRLARPLALSAASTAAGFAVLGQSGFPGLAQLGTFAAAGTATAYLITRWCLPWMISSDSSKQPRPGWMILSLSKSRAPWVRAFVFILLLTLVSGAALRGEAVWDTELANLGATSEEAREHDRRLRDQLKAPDTRIMLVVRGRDPETVLLRQEELAPQLHALVESGDLNGFEMAAKYLPSVELQLSRQDMLPEPSELKTELEEALAELPIKPEALSVFLDEVEEQRNREPLTLSSFSQDHPFLPLDALLRQQDDGLWRGLIMINGAPTDESLRLLATSAGPDVVFLDLRQQANLMLEGYRKGTFAWVFFGCIAGGIALVCGYRNIRFVAHVVTPPTIAVVLTLAGLLALGVSMNVFHIMSLLLVAGLGLDYSVVLADCGSTTGETERSLKAIVLCCASTVLVFGTLSISHVSLLHGIGLTVSIGAVASLLATLVFIEPGITSRAK